MRSSFRIYTAFALVVLLATPLLGGSLSLAMADEPSANTPATIDSTNRYSPPTSPAMAPIPDPYPRQMRVRIDRLERLATYIATLRDEQLDQRTWGPSRMTGDSTESACALGHASYLFMAEGLRKGSGTAGNIPTYGWVDGVGAGMFFFGISADDANIIFNGYRPRDVAWKVAEIRWVIAKEREREREHEMSLAIVAAL